MILYTKNKCGKCKVVKKELEVRGISYEIVNIEEVMEAKEKMLELGVKTMPVMEVNEEYITEMSKMMDFIEAQASESAE